MSFLRQPDRSSVQFGSNFFPVVATGLQNTNAAIDLNPVSMVPVKAVLTSVVCATQIVALIIVAVNLADFHFLSGMRDRIRTTCSKMQSIFCFTQ